MGIEDKTPSKHPLLHSLDVLEAAVQTMPKILQTSIKDIHNRTLALLGDTMTHDVVDENEIAALEKELVEEASWAIEKLATELYLSGEFDEQTTDRGREIIVEIQKINESMDHIPAFKRRIVND